ncbi:hypothetical protein [Hydrogenophaga atypica]|uniref:Uncharacterized protein n=1 Tax=Hydrogenophaga atypica TaxID=249409 RepID=A0ABW2QS01_9BURK
MAKHQRSKPTVSDAQVIKLGLFGLLLLVVFYILFNILLAILAPGVFLTTQLFARNNIDPSLWAWWGLALGLSSVFFGAIYFATKIHPKLTIPGYTAVCIIFILISGRIQI